MTTYLTLGTGGADTWTFSVATAGDLPATGAAGQVKLVRDTGSVVYWNGAAWAAVTAGGAGTITINDLVAIVDGSSAGLTKVNEVLSASQGVETATGVAATGVFGNVVNISVTAGRWVLNGVAGFDQNGANLSGAIFGAISSSSSGSGLAISEISKDDSTTGATTLNRSFVVPSKIISISGTTTYYLNTKFTYDAGTPRHFGQLSAQRIG